MTLAALPTESALSIKPDEGNHIVNGLHEKRENDTEVVTTCDSDAKSNQSSDADGSCSSQEKEEKEQPEQTVQPVGGAADKFDASPGLSLPNGASVGDDK